jgi:hypothetical protein
MKIITISHIKLLPDQYAYKAYQGKAEACAAEFARDYPWLDSGSEVGYYLGTRGILYVPMAFDAEAKVTEVTK